ncbi:unnamed protein product [Caretta caretta]
MTLSRNYNYWKSRRLNSHFLSRRACLHGDTLLRKVKRRQFSLSILLDKYASCLMQSHLHFHSPPDFSIPEE